MSIMGVLRRYLEKTGYAVFNTRKHYVRDGLATLHNDDFRRDPLFQAAYQRGVKASRGVDPQFEWRVHIALWAAANALRVPGDFVECGVNAGFLSSAIMRKLNWSAIDRAFYLVDTFSGPVVRQFSEEEVCRGRRDIADAAIAAGAYVTSVESVRSNFAEWPNARIIQGVIPDVLETININSVAFLHIDLNCAEPERAALEFFWPRLSSGAMVLLDDYAFLGHECQKQVIDEAARRLEVDVLSLPTGQGLIVKP